MREGQRERIAGLRAAHDGLLDRAVEALSERGAWTPFVEVPSRKAYGESARADGEAAFEDLRNSDFNLDLPGARGTVGEEVSPWGPRLGIRYPSCDPAALVAAARESVPSWSVLAPRDRAAILAEILDRLNRRSFELAFATMHTSGQGFVMAFQAGGPHAQDRGLEAVACALRAMEAFPPSATWTKRVGRDETVRLKKTYRLLPRGVGLVIGCSTFPTWNAYPGLFASLAAGNAVIVKPHPAATLPLALTVRVAREVLLECRVDPNLVTLAAESADAPLAARLATDPGVALVDYTGGSEFGAWLEEHARQATVFTEKAGVNPVVIDSVDSLEPVVANLAFSLSLYSGRMCTTPQNLFVPADGVTTASGRVPFEAFAEALAGAIDRLLEDDARAADLLGAIRSDETLARIAAAAEDDGVRVVRPSRAVRLADRPDARVRTPLLLAVDASRREIYGREMFGPVAYVVRTSGTDESLRLAAGMARERGAITAAAWSTDDAVLAAAERVLTDAGAPLSCNLSGPIWVNQAAAFSDFHVSGANPAGSGTLCDLAFVAPRFRVVQSRAPAG